ncbi:hypothetical protein [Chryseobacterium oryctis]|uniref:Lipoprotein n=1 Tax=Chryseobacterium oryctis TaxID=2952618 RepID=A0ABT3HQL8_9FLAO|nr:hypothetical protein [Chryseobacterium oryctis]MCW3161938.1 hypothetical protein [Chryseobacterium oryctis]
MKKILFLIPFVIISCKKEAPIIENSNQDSVIVAEQKNPDSGADSVALRKRDSIINNSPITKQVLQKGVMRNKKEGQIIRIADAENLPFRFGEVFTKDNQELVLKIENYTNPTLKASISTDEKDFNIRFNQIKLPNGEYDGPFGREITYDIKQKGEVWLIIGKSNMASGNDIGHFTVSVE